MTTKSELSADEWGLVREGPPTAGLIVITAAHGGMFRESIAMSKVYAQARAQHGASELLDEIVAAKPEMDHTRYATPDQLREHGLEQLHGAVEVLERKASPAETDEYRQFVLNLARTVAQAHREQGHAVSPAEDDAIGQITAALGSPAN
jgi:hypothetical protein